MTGKKKPGTRAGFFVVRYCTNARDCLPGRISEFQSARARRHPRSRTGAGKDDRISGKTCRHVLIRTVSCESSHTRGNGATRFCHEAAVVESQATDGRSEVSRVTRAYIR